MATKVIEVHLPEYGIKKKPDYARLGKNVDNVMFNDYFSYW